ncbi:VOC family protein [Arthrobacter sp. I3]|uniref:VOC family protein n=1 Tax=Arthrobacter sp. I3 TaxID=218158 RepID=UPI0031B85BE2
MTAGILHRAGVRLSRVERLSLEWEQVIVDSARPAELGLWWAKALGWVVTLEADDEFEIRSAPDRLPGLVFVPVADSKITKNRLHLDFRPDDPAAEVERMVALGARRVDVGQGERPWTVLGGSRRQRVLRSGSPKEGQYRQLKVRTDHGGARQRIPWRALGRGQPADVPKYEHRPRVGA